MPPDDALTVPGLQCRLPETPMDGDMVGNEAVPRLIGANLECLPRSLRQSVEIDRDDWAGECLQPLLQVRC